MNIRAWPIEVKIAAVVWLLAIVCAGAVLFFKMEGGVDPDTFAGTMIAALLSSGFLVLQLFVYVATGHGFFVAWFKSVKATAQRLLR